MSAHNLAVVGKRSPRQGYPVVFGGRTAVSDAVLFNGHPQGPGLEKHPGVPIIPPMDREIHR